ncbi:MAG: hypothetical protein KGQ66_17730, partial [Acidobacteriota bacterium]|nr:hypothetical protein [Acidobacteriota bacterium]
DFYKTDGLLQRMTGVIARIDSARSGRIRIGDGRILAFFVPGTRFLRSRDVNALVHFYLGFSYDGLRAWNTSPAGAGSDAAEQLSHPSIAPPREAASRDVAPAAQRRVDGQELQASLSARALAVVSALVAARGSIGSESLGHELVRQLGRPSYDAFLAGRKLRGAIEDLPGIVVTSKSVGFEVRRSGESGVGPS